MVTLREGGLHFATTPAEQREALAGRLQEGAYATGYVLLRRAQAADDLLSLGRRRTASGGVTVLRFTDRLAEPARQIVLELDARYHLRAAQAHAGGAQAVPRDLWRVLLDEAVDDVSLAVPGGATSPGREQLLDPACPPVQADTVLPPRELAFVDAPAVLPAALPDGASAAIFSRYGVRGSAPSLGRVGDVTLLVTRPGSRLTLQIRANVWSNSRAPDPPDGAEVIERGRWRLVLERDEHGAYSGSIAPRDMSNQWSPSYQVWSSGWSKDELAALTERLAPFDILDLPAYQGRFWELHPLPEPVRDVLYRAVDAERPPSGVHRLSEVEVETRDVDNVSFVNQLSDPYALAMEYVTPPRVLLRRLMGSDENGPTFGRHETILPDGTIETLYAADATRSVWYNSRFRRVDRGPAPPDAGRYLGRPTQLGMLQLLLGGGEHSLVLGTESTVVERRWPFDSSGLAVPPSWGLPFPHTVGLRAGTLVARLTIDRDGRVSSLELLHRAETGEQTLLQRAVVTSDARIPAEPSDVLALPPLGDDVLVLETAPDQSVQVLAPTDDWLGRSMEWPASTALVVQDIRPEPGVSTVALTTIQNASWQKPGVSRLWRVGEYWFGENTGTVTLIQGPSAVLGFVLRNGNGFRWTRSEALPVTIDGREQQAWLLMNGVDSVLVVEDDGLMLHVSVPTAQPPTAAEGILRGPVREALAQLVRESQ